MKENLLFIDETHKKAASRIFDYLEKIRKPKMLVAIAGEVRSGKTEISNLLGSLYRDHNVKCKIINIDSFYKIPPEERRAWRKKHGIKQVGKEEYDWKAIDQVVDDFRNNRVSAMPYVDVITRQVDQLTTDFNGIEILVINGIYSIITKGVDLRVFIEVPYHKTLKEQEMSGNEQIDEWRMKVLEKEHEVALSIKKHTDFFVDLDTSMDLFHL